jgi:hypothetical protein
MFKSFLSIVLLSLSIVSVHASEKTSPKIIDSLSLANMEFMNDTHKDNARGEWYYTYCEVRAFCQNNPSGCDETGYSYSKNQYYVKDIKRFWPDETRAY